MAAGEVISATNELAHREHALPASGATRWRQHPKQRAWPILATGANVIVPTNSGVWRRTGTTWTRALSLPPTIPVGETQDNYASPSDPPPAGGNVSFLIPPMIAPADSRRLVNLNDNSLRAGGFAVAGRSPHLPLLDAGDPAGLVTGECDHYGLAAGNVLRVYRYHFTPIDGGATDDDGNLLTSSSHQNLTTLNQDLTTTGRYLKTGAGETFQARRDELIQRSNRTFQPPELLDFTGTASPPFTVAFEPTSLAAAVRVAVSSGVSSYDFQFPAFNTVSQQPRGFVGFAGGPVFGDPLSAPFTGLTFPPLYSNTSIITLAEAQARNYNTRPQNTVWIRTLTNIVPGSTRINTHEFLSLDRSRPSSTRTTTSTYPSTNSALVFTIPAADGQSEANFIHELDSIVPQADIAVATHRKAGEWLTAALTADNRLRLIHAAASHRTFEVFNIATTEWANENLPPGTSASQFDRVLICADNSVAWGDFIIALVDYRYSQGDGTAGTATIGSGAPIVWSNRYCRDTNSWDGWTEFTDPTWDLADWPSPIVAWQAETNDGTARLVLGRHQTGGAGQTLYYELARNLPPEPPLLHSLPAVADVAEPLTLRWDFIDTNLNDTQAQFQVERTIGTARTYRRTNGTFTLDINEADTIHVSAVSAVDLLTTWGSGSDLTHTYRVRTWDSRMAGPSGWSNHVAVKPTEKINPTITTPTEGANVPQSFDLIWQAAEQSLYRVRVFADAARTLLISDTGPVADTTARSRGIMLDENGVERWIELQTHNDDVFPSEPVVLRVRVAFTPPTPALVSLVENTTDWAIDVTITPAARTGSPLPPEQTGIDLFRRIGAETASEGIRIAQLTGNEVLTWRDQTIGSAVDYAYRVTTHAANGTSSQSAWVE